MGGGSSKSEDKNEAGFKESVWGAQAPFLTHLFNQAGTLFNSTLGQQNKMAPGIVDNMRRMFGQMQNPWQQQMQGGAFADVNANDIISGINNSINQPSQSGQLYEQIMGGQGNDYLGGMKDVMAQDARGAQAQSLRGLDQRAAGAGMGGSSNYRNLQRDIIDDSNENLQNDMTALGFGTFDKDLSNKMGIAGMADQNTLARQQMLTNMLGQKQNAMTGGLNMGGMMGQQAMGQYAPSMMPWQAMGQYANTIGNPVILGSGTSGGSSDSKGFGFGF